MRIDRPNPALSELRATWSRVMEHLPELRRIARSMATCDKRINGDDLLGEALADIVASEHLYDETRGPWLRWAKTRVWKTRTYAIRDLNAHAPRGRVGIGAPNRDDPDSDSVEPAVGPGADGEASRSEARIVLREVLDEATDEEADAALLVLHGFPPRMGGGKKSVDARLASLRARCGPGWR